MKISFITLSLFCISCWVGCKTRQKAGTANNNTFENASVQAIFDEVQKNTFQYFYMGAEPVSGLARERYHVDGVYPQNDKNVVTSGGAGFGVMALIVGMERGFITRAEGGQQLSKIISFLERADKFYGAFPHWWNGETGKAKPFSKKDDGGDLVETSFMLQGLLCMRQYFKNGSAEEKALAVRANKLWRDVNFNWYRNGKNVLYWHWSPNYAWQMNFPIHGYNECMITYLLAVASPTYGVPVEVYHEGWAENGKVVHRSGYKTDSLQLYYQGKPPHGGPLFWAHYSFLGLDPRGLKDKYADYWKELTSLAKINYQWCVDNPKNYKGYSDSSWGLTASYSVKGYAGHAPALNEDLGVISPTAALSSFPYTPAQSTAAMVNWYNNSHTKLFGPYGFYDAFSVTENWYPQRYLAIDQGPIVVMMENYRSGLLWNLFMSCPEIQSGLKKLGFSSPHIR